jgi:hypothetical protein
MKEKLYCYVDETGQDTKGRLFIVSVVVTGETRDEFLTRCEELEETTGKEKFTGGKAKNDRRLAYLRAVCSDRRFQGALCYAIFRKTTDYDSATIETIARAFHGQESKDDSASIFVDGLAKTKCREYTVRLRKLGVVIQKVRGVRKDENNALTRLADAVAGFVRDVEEGQGGEAKTLFNQIKQLGFLVQV